MRNVLIWLTLITYFGPFAAAKSDISLIDQAEIPHLDPEMTGAEYESYLLQFSSLGQSFGALDPILAIGKRNLDWLRFINQGRSDSISFSHPSTQAGYPMDKPNQYNEAIALQKYKDLLLQLPPEMKRVLFDGEPFTKDTPVPLDQYILWGHATDRVYQTATRWIMMKQYLWQLESRRANDVRGFYFLSQDPERENKFSQFSKLPNDLQIKIKEWLVQMCLNNGKALSSCKTEVNSAATSGTLSTLYRNFSAAAEVLWSSFFTIQAKYGSVFWSDPNRTIVPFVTPNSQDKADFISKNIQEEWRLQNWQLEVSFGKTGIGVIWQPGIVPHVPGLGVGTIYMDANQPLTEYDGQWTIRHEFGHVLGFPDCYIEFYDRDAGVIINYQIDTTNLMCSRRGHLQPKHLDELKRKYF
jgi:hypothetical protein